MRLNIRSIIGVSAAALVVSFAAQAEDVTISTYYPSPFGSYQQLTTTGLTQLATAGGNVNLAAGGGNVNIGAPLAGNKLVVNGLGGGSVDLLVTGRIATGDAGGAGGVWVDAAQTQFVGAAGANIMGFFSGGRWRFLADSLGNVRVGDSTPGARLDVDGPIFLRDAASNAGNLAVSCDGNGCYATYAP